jgi:hypothetical protein
MDLASRATQAHIDLPSRPALSKPALAASWAAQLVVAAILAQTLYFKFTYAAETQVIFGRLGGRPVATLVGLTELACVVLLLFPRTPVLGAFLALATIGGAIVLHLTVLGIQIINPATGKGDGGLLFALAVLVALGSFVVLALRWRELPWLATRA